MEKKNFKFLRRAHWNTCQELKARLAELPPSYSLRVDLSGVNFSRLRPYFYLLVHKVHWYFFFFFFLSTCENLFANKRNKVFTVIFLRLFSHHGAANIVQNENVCQWPLSSSLSSFVWCSTKKPGNFAKKRSLCTEKLINDKLWTEDHGSLKKLGCLVFIRDL